MCDKAIGMLLLAWHSVVNFLRSLSCMQANSWLRKGSNLFIQFCDLSDLLTTLCSFPSTPRILWFLSASHSFLPPEIFWSPHFFLPGTSPLEQSSHLPPSIWFCVILQIGTKNSPLSFPLTQTDFSVLCVDCNLCLCVCVRACVHACMRVWVRGYMGACLHLNSFLQGLCIL